MTPIKFNLHDNQDPLVIVGLGNIGKDYENTRHNAGFIFADALQKYLFEKGYDFIVKQEAEYSLFTCHELNLSIIKPKTLMNLSGKAVVHYYRFHKGFKANRLVVVHDDLDLALGDYKINAGKGPKLHNGLRSIEQEISNNEFIRIRIGIENRQGVPISGLDYVLCRFNSQEISTLNDCITKIIKERFQVK